MVAKCYHNWTVFKRGDNREFDRNPGDPVIYCTKCKAEEFGGN